MAALILALAIAQGVPAGDAAVRAHLECVHDQVAKLDDGRMDPQRLAKTILPLCHAEHEAAVQATGGSPARFDKDRQELELMHTWAAVLLARQRIQTAR